MGRWPLASPAPQGKRSLPHSRCAVRAAAINTPSPALRHFFLPGDAGGGRPERDAGCPPAPQRRARTNLSLILPSRAERKEPAAGAAEAVGGVGGVLHPALQAPLAAARWSPRALMVLMDPIPRGFEQNGFPAFTPERTGGGGDPRSFSRLPDGCPLSPLRWFEGAGGVCPEQAAHTYFSLVNTFPLYGENCICLPAGAELRGRI